MSLLFTRTRLSRLASMLLVTAGTIVACSSEDPAAAPNPTGKAEGAQCAKGAECQSLTCKTGKCTKVTGANPTDKTRNGDETDVDCGGASAPGCADGKACKTGADCANAICTSGKCAKPSPTDKAKNGDETDVDCGGAEAPKCGAEKGCQKDSDCASGGCSYAKKCAASPSCVNHFGGDTCGAGETGEAGAKHESCCATVEVAGARVGKYHITAGRMRAFVEKYQGNLQEWAPTNPHWKGDVGDLPASMDDAMFMLGPDLKRGCSLSGDGGRTYWQENPPDGEKSPFSKDVLDEKALNCLPYVLATALCNYDGGRLVRTAEVTALITNGGDTRFPWGDTPAFQHKQQQDQVVHFNSYATPNAPNGSEEQDRAFFVAPPGRRPLGNNQAGAADAVGNVLTWVDDSFNRFAWTSSWEGHHLAGVRGADGATKPPSQTWNENESERLGYYAIGARCAFDD